MGVVYQIKDLDNSSKPLPYDRRCSRFVGVGIYDDPHGRSVCFLSGVPDRGTARHSRMTNVISPKGRCRIATEGCRLRLRNIPTETGICFAYGWHVAEKLGTAQAPYPTERLICSAFGWHVMDRFSGGAFLGGDAFL